jgi:hypothetical protein
MLNTNLRVNFLMALHTVKYATLYNFAPFFNKTAQSFPGSLCQARVLFRWALKHGFIKPIRATGRDYIYGKEQFYCLTKKGADFIDVHDYKNIVIKSINNAAHESAKIDSCLSFVYNYSEYDVDVTYPSTKHFRIKPDAVITVTGDKQYVFCLEVERSREAIQIVNEKIKKYEDFDFEKYRFSDKTKVLFIVSHKRFDPYWRPIQYIEKYDEIKKEQDKVKILINLLKDKYIKRYRITGLTNYLHIHKSVWFDTHGRPTKLIH